VLAAFIRLLRMRSPWVLSPFASSPDVTGGTTTHGQYCWSAWLLLLVRALRSRPARRERVHTPLACIYDLSAASSPVFARRTGRFFLAFSTIAARRRRTLFASSPELRTVVIQSPRLLLFGANFHSERGVVRHIPRLRVAETIVAKRTAAFERLVMSA